MNVIGKIVFTLAVVGTALVVAAYAYVGYMTFIDPYSIPDYSEETAVEFDESGYQLVCHLSCDADKPKLPGFIWQYREPLVGCEVEELNDGTQPVCRSYYTGQSRARSEHKDGGCDNMFGCL